MSPVTFFGQRNRLTREEAIERYILLRLRAEDIARLRVLVEGLYGGTVQVGSGPFSGAELRDTVRIAFFGWFATLTDRDSRAVYAFDPLLVLFPGRKSQIIKVQIGCEACHEVLQQFRNNVAFHTRARFLAYIKVRRAISHQDAFLDLQSARNDFRRLMSDLIAEELEAIPELPKILRDLGIQDHPAFRKPNG